MRKDAMLLSNQAVINEAFHRSRGIPQHACEKLDKNAIQREFTHLN